MNSDLTRRTFSLVFSAAAVFGLSACGDSTGPDGPGSVDVVMYDGSAQATRGPSSAAAADTYSGTFEGEVTVEISTDGQTWIDVSPPTSATVDLQSEDRTTITTEAEVAGGSYSHIRITLRSATATLDVGAQIGGTTLGTEANISIGGGSDVVVEKEVFPFSLDADVQMVLSVDLNSEAWVSQQSVTSGTAASSEIQSATSVEVRRK
jgi:hypothetical protein